MMLAGSAFGRLGGALLFVVGIPGRAATAPASRLIAIVNLTMFKV
jgi:hypothetical protein